ncbi:MAG: hypothetical protein ABL907_17440, partial [Hyphomicrobium sp.]
MTGTAAKTSRMPGTGLALAVLGLAALNWQILSTPVDLTPIAPPPAGPGATTSTVIGDAAPVSRAVIGGDSEILARPLFRPDRRPFVPKPVAEVVPPPPEQAPAAVPTPPQSEPAAVPVPPLPPGLKLVGIVGGVQGARRALLRSAEMPEGKWYPLGSDLNGWKITRIDADEALLAANGET